MNTKEMKRLANTVWEGWMALHQSSVAGKGRNIDFCRCDPDVGATPCEYCALHGALTAADTALRELAGRRRMEATYICSGCDSVVPENVPCAKCADGRRRS